MPCVPSLAGMEVAGIQVNVDQFAQFAQDIQVKLTAISTFIEEEVGHAVNVNSPKQVSTLLYKERGLTPSKKTKSGGSTDSTSLQLLLEQTDDPVIPKILEYREIGKIKSTYLDALPTFVRSDGRIHTHLHQTVTATGRLSSSSPNLQNIPVRKSWGKIIRQCFVASTGRVLISADYSQIEMRVLAHLCGEGVLVDTFNAGEDVHTRTAKDIAEEGVELTPELRNIAKAINYGLIYGMSSYRLARELAISRDEASTYMKRYFERYPEIKSVLDGLIEDARSNGYAQTIFGRQRPIYNLDSIDKNQREAAERIALNAPVQGAAADIMKIAMCKVAQVLTQKHPTAKLLLQVHDELVLECYPNEAEDIVRLLREEMTNVAQLHVPLVVDVMIGDTWGDIH
jgi:DNA polymerase-1